MIEKKVQNWNWTSRQVKRWTMDGGSALRENNMIDASIY